jgi:hypothetical protein
MNHIKTPTDAHTTQGGAQHGDPGQIPGGGIFVFEVEGTTYKHNRPKITGGAIMDISGIPREQGLIQIHPDGTTTSVAADQEVHLVPKPQFKRRPRFKRG